MVRRFFKNDGQIGLKEPEEKERDHNAEGMITESTMKAAATV